MSLYNALFGVNPVADVLLACLGTTRDRVPRFRDCFLDDGCIVIHTRTGGGNRDFYESEEECRSAYPEYFEGDDPPKGPWNVDLRALPGFLRDEDDDFDCTYADFYYAFPKEYEAELRALAENAPQVTPNEKWKLLLASLRKRDAD